MDVLDRQVLGTGVFGGFGNMPRTSGHVVIPVDEVLLRLDTNGFLAAYQTIVMSTCVECQEPRDTLYIHDLLPVISRPRCVVFHRLELIGESSTANQLIASMHVVASNLVDDLALEVLVDIRSLD